MVGKFYHSDELHAAKSELSKVQTSTVLHAGVAQAAQHLLTYKKSSNH